MATRVSILGAHSSAGIVYELFKEAISTEIEYGGGTGDYEIVAPIEIVRVYEVPCKPVFDDRYTGKCKKFRKEAKGWR
jgi:hypothetical protein